MGILGASSVKKGSTGDFGFLPADACYLDSACQTLRPEAVINAEADYYRNYNACGGRVKYAWGERVDAEVWETRQKLLLLAGKRASDYAVAFTLNTTSGLNLILQQLPQGQFSRVVTSQIEHNSVFVPTMTAAARLGVPRMVLHREDDGSLVYRPEDLAGAVVVLNNLSNIDGRPLPNAGRLARDVHAAGGILVLDGAQAFGHASSAFADVDFDAACGSSHKMYGPSLGFIIIKKTLLEGLDYRFLGGGTVSDVREQDFEPIGGEGMHERLEPGLQNFAGIIGLGAALSWAQTYRPEGSDPHKHERALAAELFAGLRAQPKVTLLNTEPSAVTSFHVEGLDAHRLARYLSAQGIMVRSGYFCCHYYLKHVRGLPPLVRVSLGLHNTHADVEHFASTLNTILKNV